MPTSRSPSSNSLPRSFQRGASIASLRPPLAKLAGPSSRNSAPRGRRETGPVGSLLHPYDPLDATGWLLCT